MAFLPTGNSCDESSGTVEAKAIHTTTLSGSQGNRRILRLTEALQQADSIARVHDMSTSSETCQENQGRL
jgi:hypothetical protein